jgi:hypothetical protein
MIRLAVGVAQQRNDIGAVAAELAANGRFCGVSAAESRRRRRLPQNANLW